jgi:hypothetical protein
VQPFPVEEAIGIGKRLLADPIWAKRVSDFARARLSHYSPQACLRRLGDGLEMDLVSQIRTEMHHTIDE